MTDYSITLGSATGVGQAIGVTTGDAVTSNLPGTMQQFLRGFVKLANDGLTHNLTITNETITPQALLTHRSNISSADGTSSPAANNANWAANPGSKEKARFHVQVTFTGGSSPSITFRPYIRCGGSSGKVGGTDSETFTQGNWTSDIQTDGDDVLGWVEAINGSPDTTDVDIYLSWR